MTIFLPGNFKILRFCCFILQIPEKLSVSQSEYKTRLSHGTENEF